MPVPWSAHFTLPQGHGGAGRGVALIHAAHPRGCWPGNPQGSQASTSHGHRPSALTAASPRWWRHFACWTDLGLGLDSSHTMARSWSFCLAARCCLKRALLEPASTPQELSQHPCLGRVPGPPTRHPDLKAPGEDPPPPWHQPGLCLVPGGRTEHAPPQGAPGH